MSAAPPVVTVIVPMLDEAGSIEACLDGFRAQTYPKELTDVVVVDGGSTDGSRAIVERFARTNAWVRIIENPRRKASTAFNVGVDVAKGEVVCLFSAHGVPDREYLEASVRVLDETGAVGVGGRYRHVGLDPVSRAIGLAMVSPIGMASPHRFATRRAVVDTISHPAYRREALCAVGPFDESLERNSDYELNWRLREMGGSLIFDPSIGSVYRPRPSLSDLGRQFYWYGRWKVRVAARHPRSLRLRHLVAPAALIAVAAAPVLACSRSGRRVVFSGAALYAAAVGAGCAAARPGRRGADIRTLVAAFPVMHASWGAGVLVSVGQGWWRT